MAACLSKLLVISDLSTMDDKGPRRQYAKVKNLAIDPYSGVSDNKSEVSSEILSRIKKCLDRANHPTTPEAEARAALRVAHKLMQQYNVQQADVYANAVDADEISLVSGQSTVSIFSNKGKVQQETWTSHVGSAIRIFFDCNAYITTRQSSIEWTFYGIALNTAAAAMSFEMVINLTQEWAFQRKKGNKNSYRLGIAGGLSRLAHKEKEVEKKLAEEQEAADLAARVQEEEAQRQLEINRLQQIEISEQRQAALSVNECVAKVSSDPQLVFICAALALQEEASQVSAGETFQKDDSASNISRENAAPSANQEESFFDAKTYQTVEIENADEDELNDRHQASTTGSEFEDDGVSNTVDLDSLSDTDDIAINEPFLTFKEEDEELLDPSISLDETLRRHMPMDADYMRQDISVDDNDNDNSLQRDTPTKASTGAANLHTEDQTVAWRSTTALVKYREDALKIAEDYLKEKDMKLKKGRKRNWNIIDQQSYDDGKVDSTKIDVKRRRIDGGDADSDKESDDGVKRRRIEI